MKLKPLQFLVVWTIHINYLIEAASPGSIINILQPSYKNDYIIILDFIFVLILYGFIQMSIHNQLVPPAPSWAPLSPVSDEKWGDQLQAEATEHPSSYTFSQPSRLHHVLLNPLHASKTPSGLGGVGKQEGEHERLTLYCNIFKKS